MISARAGTFSDRRGRRCVPTADGRCPDARGRTDLDTLSLDARLALRHLARNPGFTAAALLTLALGIGANTAVFSVLDGVLLQPLPWPAPERLVRVVESMPGMPPGRGPAAITSSTWHAWRDEGTTVSDLAAWSPRSWALATDDGPVRERGAAVSPGLFPLLAVEPAIGRLPRDDEGRPGASRVALLSDALWRERFAADPGVVGRVVRLDDEDHTVVGVLPPGTDFPDAETRLWTALAVPRFEQTAGEHRIMALPAIARLAPGVSRAQAEAEATAVSSRALPRPPGDAARVELRPLADEVAGEVRPALLVLGAAVWLVLMIAAANIANLLLARGAERHRELAVRAALGAGRGRLARQLLTEGTVLALLGGALGALLALAAVRALPALLPAGFPRVEAIALDGRGLLFCLGVALLTGLLAGLAPALQAAGADLRRGLSEAGIAPGGGRRQAGARLRAAFAVTQVALAVVLLTGAGLLLRSFGRLVAVDPGYVAADLLTAQVPLPRSRYDDAATAAFADRLLERLGADPGVRAAGITNALPLVPGEAVIGFELPGRPDAGADPVARARLRVVSPGYVEAMGIPLVAGRHLDERDRGDGVAAVLVNRSFAATYLRDVEPVGFRLPGVVGPSGDAEIVGVIGNVRHGGLDAEPQPELYVSYRQAGQEIGTMHRGPTLVVRTLGDPLAWAPSLARHLEALDPALALAAPLSMEQRVAGSLSRPRLYAGLLAVFAALALLLASVGVYAVLARSVQARHREIGVRLAIGASPAEVGALVAGEGLRLAGVGLGLGLLAAAALSPALAGLLFGVAPRDPVTLAGVAGTLAVVAAAACLLPARRAAGLDPAEALRAE